MNEAQVCPLLEDINTELNGTKCSISDKQYHLHLTFFTYFNTGTTAKKFQITNEFPHSVTKQGSWLGWKHLGSRFSV